MEFIRNLFFKNKPYKIAETLECGFLNVANNHSIYYETAGNPNGVPVVILHGGPGVGMSNSKRKYYNPEKYYMIHFDQRGCGKSLPSFGLEDNNTMALINDMEDLRKHLKIKKWVVAGGSWGSTLALAYSLTHKNRVHGLVLNGLFLASKKEYEETYNDKGVASKLYPEQYSKFIEPLTKTESKNPLKAYISKIKKVNGIEQQYLLRQFARWSWLQCMMQPDLDFIDSEISSEKFDSAMTVLEMHYLENDFFIDSDEMLNSLPYLSGIPVYMVQGRYDIVCPPTAAHKVYQQIKGSKLVFTFDGHSISSKQGKEQFVIFTNELLEKIKEEKNV